MRIQDRQSAGRLLAPLVARQALERPVVIGIGVGGLAVAAEIAHTLGCPLDILELQELEVGDAFHPARPVGAFSTSGHLLIRSDALEHFAEQTGDVLRAVNEARHSEDQADQRPQSRLAIPTWWRSVVLVDDGTSSLEAISAALDLVRSGRPRRVLLALPTAPQEHLDGLSSLTGEVIVAAVAPWTEWFHWHGSIYEDEQLPSRQQVDHLLAV
jgi:hypothetical protein